MASSPAHSRSASSTTAAVTPSFRLSPTSRLRRHRSSFSPRKTPKTLQSHQKSFSFSEPTPAFSFPNDASPRLNSSTAALEFEEFSFWGPDGTLRGSNVTEEHQTAMWTYLKEKYDVVDFSISEPFILLGMDGELPNKDERPFTIAGLVAVWKPFDEMGFLPLLGSPAQGKEIKIDPEMLEAMEGSHNLPNQVILYLADNIFKDCIALSLVWGFLVVELPETSLDEFFGRLRKLPCRIVGTRNILLYYNGPMPTSEMRRRATKPEPEVLANLICDETNYIAKDNKFYPGAMISSVCKNNNVYSSISAGILIEKDGERRLTCPYHNWEEHVKKYSHLFGNTDEEARKRFKVVQGDPGAAVGFVRERIGSTDIALAQLNDDIVFENSFMEMECSAKTLVHSKDQQLGDQYLIDGFCTGKQMLMGVGSRATVGRSGRRPQTVQSQLHIAPEANKNDIPRNDCVYIAATQGIYTTGDEVSKEPIIRSSVCGAVLLRCASANQANQEEEEVATRGEICGMMHFADIVRKNALTELLVYADSFDPLIDEKWKIVQVPENGAATMDASEEAGIREPAVEESADGSPAKKQRRN